MWLPIRSTYCAPTVVWSSHPNAPFADNTGVFTAAGYAPHVTVSVPTMNMLFATRTRSVEVPTGPPTRHWESPVPPSIRGRELHANQLSRAVPRYTLKFMPRRVTLYGLV